MKKALLPHSLLDMTPKNRGLTSRGTEIKQWLEDHPEITEYIILDDGTDFLEGQPLFKTNWETGLTQEIVERIIDFLNSSKCKI